MGSPDNGHPPLFMKELALAYKRRLIRYMFKVTLIELTEVENFIRYMGSSDNGHPPPFIMKELARSRIQKTID